MVNKLHKLISSRLLNLTKSDIGIGLIYHKLYTEHKLNSVTKVKRKVSKKKCRVKLKTKVKKWKTIYRNMREVWIIWLYLKKILAGY